MTYAEQRKANEALGIAAKALQDAADRLDLSVSKGYLHGIWTIYVTSLSSTVAFIEEATTEVEAIDKTLDQLNRVEAVQA